MIIRELNTHYIFIQQHHHGLLSGEMAFHWGKENFLDPLYKLVLAAAFHDMSWIKADHHLLWNNAIDKPYDFVNYPLNKRIELYTKGINEAETFNQYLALLTSMHYTSFFKSSENEIVSSFLEQEHNRQIKLKRLHYEHNSDLLIALKHLKMWDDLSLYACLNEPGTEKSKEHTWFKNGINGVDKYGNHITIECEWKNERTISLKPFPFKNTWKTNIPYSLCRKSLGQDDPDKYSLSYFNVTFVPDL
ncbi:DUF3891 family protein [Bacillus taeanensis]|nr:DUF3891 family protein [Bacillus taeanensis]